MALSKCPECGGRLSSHASRCPHCGIEDEDLDLTEKKVRKL